VSSGGQPAHHPEQEQPPLRGGQVSQSGADWVDVPLGRLEPDRCAMGVALSE